MDEPDLIDLNSSSSSESSVASNASTVRRISPVPSGGIPTLDAREVLNQLRGNRERQYPNPYNQDEDQSSHREWQHLERSNRSGGERGVETTDNSLMPPPTDRSRSSTPRRGGQKRSASRETSPGINATQARPRTPTETTQAEASHRSPMARSGAEGAPRLDQAPPRPSGQVRIPTPPRQPGGPPPPTTNSRGHGRGGYRRRGPPRPPTGGIYFQSGLNRVMFNETTDPEAGACFACWEFGHGAHECPHPDNVDWCCNCGRREVTIDTCPKCRDVYRKSGRVLSKFPRGRGTHRAQAQRSSRSPGPRRGSVSSVEAPPSSGLEITSGGRPQARSGNLLRTSEAPATSATAAPTQRSEDSRPAAGPPSRPRESQEDGYESITSGLPGPSQGRPAQQNLDPTSAARDEATAAPGVDDHPAQPMDLDQAMDRIVTWPPPIQIRVMSWVFPPEEAGVPALDSGEAEQRLRRFLCWMNQTNSWPATLQASTAWVLFKGPRE